MDEVDVAHVVQARKALHAVAENLIAGPQHRLTGEIALAVSDRGFASTHPVADGIPRIEVTGAGVVAGPGPGVPLAGSVRTIATALGVEPGAPAGLYGEHAELGLDDDLDVDPAAVDVVLTALVEGNAALTELDGGQAPVLWPEHFDVGLSVGEVNYGVSPGDAAHDLPYAYVGPWQPRPGEFWNEPFGASRPISELSGSDGILTFFRAGQQEASKS